MKVYIVYVFLTHLFLGFRTKISVLTAHILNLYVHTVAASLQSVLMSNTYTELSL